jgi:magnesium chelatase family protein
VRAVLSLPARFQLVGAMNPCPCGHHGDASKPCRCSPNAIRTYLARLSGPLLDRIDLHVEVPALPYSDLAGPSGETSPSVAARVAQARDRQRDRERETGALTNADLDPAALRRVATLEAAGEALIAGAMSRFSLTARGVGRLLRVARTVADLSGSPTISPSHVAEALHYRWRPASPGYGQA